MEKVNPLGKNQSTAKIRENSNLSFSKIEKYQSTPKINQKSNLSLSNIGKKTILQLKFKKTRSDFDIFIFSTNLAYKNRISVILEPQSKKGNAF